MCTGLARSVGRTGADTAEKSCRHYQFRDSLLACKKPQLVARLRAALKRVEELETALAVQAANCQEQHIRNVLALRVDVARLEAQRHMNLAEHD
jgi:hypothetical protein